MGITAENVAKEYGITREEQDAFAALSQNKAEAAQKAGRFDDEIVPVAIPQRKGEPLQFATDEFVRHGVTAESLAGLKPAFSRRLGDGGERVGAERRRGGGAGDVGAEGGGAGLTPLARIKAYANAGVDPSVMGWLVPASRRCWSARLDAGRLDLMEINEAFAAQALAVHKQMGWDTSKVNVNGGRSRSGTRSARRVAGSW